MSAVEADLLDVVVTRLELLSQADFDKACVTAARLRVPLERVLIERARIPMTFLLEQLAHAWAVGYIDVTPGDVAPEALAAVNEVYARKHNLVPMQRTDKELHVAMTNPRDARVIDEIARMASRRVVPFLAPETSIRRAQLLYRGDLGALLERTAAHEGTGALTGAGRDEAASALLDRILEYAAVTGASDIHIEPYELETLVRCRIDGALRDVLSVTPEIVAGLVARIKILGGMRIDDRRSPQDGRFDTNLDGLRLALRVSSLPTVWGEKVVLRILSEEATAIDLDDLGLAPSDHEAFVRNLARPFGMVLVTGPTGSGKTTTLYAMLARIGAERQNMVNISTIEDPVEYRLPRVNQAPVNVAAGLDFASGLRALLRQDPDVIMVGEMRDRETAETAVRAALVGRLVISTLHTNDATAAVARLLDMGIEPFLLASTLSFVVGQRLVRRICMKCRQSVTVDSRVADLLRARLDSDGSLAMLRKEGVLGPGDDPLAGLRMFRGNGCRQCHGTGYHGRLGIYEAFEVDREAHAMIMARADGASLRAGAIARGMKTMFQDGIAKVFLGHTTLQEVLRVAQ